jgi:DNA-binding NtrC family response regulator
MLIEIVEGDVALRSVMIVEDEALVAVMMESVIRELGVQTIETFACCADARARAGRGNIDCAVLDVRVRDGVTTELAEELVQQGIPVVFTTGMGLETLPERFRELPAVSKPFSDETLKLSIIDAVAARRARNAAPARAAARVATSPATE